jgi:oligopeptidase B
VVLDLNQLAEGKRYFSIGGYEVSPDHRLVAFAVDTTGAERFTLMVKEIATGRILPDRVPNVNYSLEWALDNRTLFYGTSDDANRAWRIWRHALGTDPAADVKVAEEPDVLYRLDVSRSKDRRFLFTYSGSFDTSEMRFLDAANPTGEWRTIRPRQPGVLYSAEHHGDRFFIRTNENAVNFKLVEAPVSDPSPRNWKDLVPASDSVLLDNLDVFRDHLVLYLRANALRQIRVVKLSTGQRHDITFEEPVFTASPASNPEFDTSTLRFAYQSMVTPQSIYDYDMDARTRVLKKRTEVVGGFDPSLYGTERTWARAADGTMVPVSLVYRKPLRKDGQRPLLLYAYGSYGISTDPTFSSFNLSLLDRGWCTPSRTSAAGRRWGAPGTTRGS